MQRRWHVITVCTLLVATIFVVLPAQAAHWGSSVGERAPGATGGQLDSVYAGPIPPVHYAFHLGSIGVVYRGGEVMEIYGINERSEGVLLLFITQPEVDAVQPYGLVATSADGTVAVTVWEDRNVTISMGGPSNEGKVHYVTLKGGLGGEMLEYGTRLGSAPGSETASPLRHPFGMAARHQRGRGRLRGHRADPFLGFGHEPDLCLGAGAQ